MVMGERQGAEKVGLATGMRCLVSALKGRGCGWGKHRAFDLLIYLFLTVLGLCCCSGFFSSGGEWRLLFVAVSFSLQWLLLLWSLDSRVCGLSSCGFWAQ